MRFFTCLALCAALAAGPALANPPLREVAEIDDTLMAVAIADEIRKSCDGIDARMLRALNTLSSLKRLARARGYSDAEIEAYVTSKAEKKRMRAKAEGYLAGQGITSDDKAGLCDFGRTQIAQQTAIGRLLR